MFGAPFAGHISRPLSELTQYLWKSLQTESSKIKVLFEEFLAPLQIEAYKEAYASPEKLLKSDLFVHEAIEPYKALKLIDKPAQLDLIKQGFLEEASKVYEQALALERKEREKEKKLKIGKGGRPITQKKDIAQGVRRRIYKHDNYECVYCGVTIIPDYELSASESPNRQNAGSIDHMVPGNNDFENLVTACQSCNSAKSNRTPEEAGLVPKYGRFSSQKK